MEAVNTNQAQNKNMAKINAKNHAANKALQNNKLGSKQDFADFIEVTQNNQQTKNDALKANNKANNAQKDDNKSSDTNSTDANDASKYIAHNLILQQMNEEASGDNNTQIENIDGAANNGQNAIALNDAIDNLAQIKAQNDIFGEQAANSDAVTNPETETSEIKTNDDGNSPSTQALMDIIKGNDKNAPDGAPVLTGAKDASGQKTMPKSDKHAKNNTALENSSDNEETADTVTDANKHRDISSDTKTSLEVNNQKFAKMLENNAIKITEFATNNANSDNVANGTIGDKSTTNDAPTTNIDSSTSTNSSPDTNNNLRVSLNNIHSMAAIIARRHLNGERSFTIRLDPAELGEIKVELKVDAQKKVSAIISATNEDALGDLTKSAKDLAQAVQDSGFDLNEEDMEFNLQSQFANDFSSFGNQQEQYEKPLKSKQNIIPDNNILAQTIDAPPARHFGWQNMRVSMIV